MDSSGRVISHQSTEVQNNMTFVHTEDYNYDSDGYISSIAMKLNGTTPLDNLSPLPRYIKFTYLK